ncbi:MAG: rod shape-determining protein MreC [Paenibacillaceae bacterium]|jgi:rod shape-determining protein MreC|uniref:rod shape-determining protein MreC n=1 Tax=Thermobacillus xylanilyticus TaxID=76633 RepID=UPI000E3A942B|nr:rod shape-determining protein MreC [Thermobacillus xylanilyticus]REJ19000.1 MAG: rod shape-determining protein MreC [Paenibacillaceae bacterium]
MGRVSGLFRIFRNKKLFVLLIVLIVFAAIMGFSLGQRDKLTWPENFVGDTVTFVQQWFYKPAGYLAGLFEDIRKMRDIYRENEELRRTVARYARDRVTYNRIELENERLKEALAFKERQKRMFDYEYVIAQVVAVSQDPLNPTFKINLGSTDGIKPDMAVITTDGLVGLVSRVFPLYSTVMPITQLDSESSGTRAISATVMEHKESFGVIEDYDVQRGMLVMNRIAENDPLSENDVVITSGLGGVYPYGLVIGTVESRQVGDFGLTHTAYIKPAADFDRLTEVFVVVPPDTEGAAP